MTQNGNPEIQLEMEHAFHKNQALPRLREIYSHVDILDHLKSKEIPETFGVELLAQIMINKSLPLAALVAMLEGTLERQEEHSMGEHLQAVASLLERCVDAQLVLYILTGNIPMIHVKHEVSAEIQEEMAQWQFPLPMVSRPMKLKSNRDTGYLSPLVNKGSILMNHKNHGQDVCLDHLDRMNSTALSINLDTARMTSNQSDKISSPRPGEEEDDYLKRVNAFTRFNEESKEVIEAMSVTGNRFWLTHAYDKRGRTYARGYHINTQGADWTKNIIELADKEVVQ